MTRGDLQRLTGPKVREWKRKRQPEPVTALDFVKAFSVMVGLVALWALLAWASL